MAPTGAQAMSDRCGDVHNGMANGIDVRSATLVQSGGNLVATFVNCTPLRSTHDGYGNLTSVPLLGLEIPGGFHTTWTAGVRGTTTGLLGVPGSRPGSNARASFAKVDSRTVRYTVALASLGRPKVLRWFAMGLEGHGYFEVAPDTGAVFVTR
jgi:hypothetical protein